jgi:hypothetical protein
MAEHAALLAAQDRTRSRQELVELSKGAIRTVDQVKTMTEWLLERLPPEGCDIILKREQEIDENQVITRPAKYSMSLTAPPKPAALVPRASRSIIWPAIPSFMNTTRSRRC